MEGAVMGPTRLLGGSTSVPTQGSPLSLGHLHQFTEASLLRQLALDSSKAYFDKNPAEHHHHYLEDEDTIIDMPSAGAAVTDFPLPPFGIEVVGVDVNVRLRKARQSSNAS
jgi:Fe2+ or Zn2+ uptake regulation protein